MTKYPEFTTGLLISAFACGILLAEYSGMLAVAVICAIPIICSIWYKPAKVILVIGAITCFLGCIRYTTYTQISPDDISILSGRTTAFTGWISQEPEMKKDILRFVLRCKNAQTNGRTVPVTGSVAIYVHTDALPAVKDCQYGDHLTIKGDTYIPSDATNPGQFSYQKYLHRQGIYSACSVWNAQNIQKLGDGTGNPFLSAGISIRRYLVSGINKAFPEREASVVAGMVLGTYAYLPDDVYDAFSRTGTLHLLAASGFNCYVVILFSIPLLRLKKMKPTTRNFIMIALVLTYLLVVGMKPSMERAAMMACLGLLAIPFKRIPKYSNLLLATGLFILLIKPTELFDIGFQLSFCAVAALVWVSPVIDKFLPWYAQTRAGLKATSGWTRIYALRAALYFMGTASSTIAITILTTPLIVYYFNYISTTSLLCNIVMAGTVAGVFGAGAVSGLLSFIPPISAVAGFVGTLITRFSLGIVTFFGSHEWSAIAVASPEPIIIIFYYIALGLGLYLLRIYNAAK